MERNGRYISIDIPLPSKTHFPELCNFNIKYVVATILFTGPFRPVFSDFKHMKMFEFN